MQQKTKAFLYGWAVVIIALAVALVTGDKRYFRNICEWVFFVSFVVAAVIFISKPKTETNKPKRKRRLDRNIDTALEIFKASQPSGDNTRNDKKETPKKQQQANQDKNKKKFKNPRPDPWKLRRENIEPAATAFYLDSQSYCRIGGILSF